MTLQRWKKAQKIRMTRNSDAKSFIFRIKTILLAWNWFSLSIIAYILWKQKI